MGFYHSRLEVPVTPEKLEVLIYKGTCLPSKHYSALALFKVTDDSGMPGTRMHTPWLEGFSGSIS